MKEFLYKIRTLEGKSLREYLIQELVSFIGLIGLIVIKVFFFIAIIWAIGQTIQDASKDDPYDEDICSGRYDPDC